MVEWPATSVGRTIAFGPFRLLPAQQLLLEDEVPVRLGTRALEILAALVERPGEIIGKNELIARVWPNIKVDDTALRVHVAGLRRALGDGQPGRRYLANLPGRGYRFVAPVSLAEPERPSPLPPERPSNNNLPLSKSRVLGRTGIISTLCDQLSRQRLVTIVGAGGVGKTTVALAVAEALLPAYPDGVRFIDLAPVENPQFVQGALGAALGIVIDLDNPVPGIIDFLSDKRMLIVFDSCEHVIESAAHMAERLLLGTFTVHILATSREPLRVEGERVHRLPPLDMPSDSASVTAAEALTYPAVQLFVERAAGIVDGFELSDADAPAVSDICRRLGGVALAIELAAARVDAFGIQQLAVLLDDRFHILKRGKRTAQPRHQSLSAALDWSYAYLPEREQLVLCRLSIFAAAFTLESAIAVAGDDRMDVVEDLANLVAKSLVSADVSEPIVQYRLLDTTRAYAMQKLIDGGAFEDCARRHALHHLDWFKNVEANWQTRTTAEWLVEYGRRIEDLRSALNWAFSPNGDLSIAVTLTAASCAQWPAMAPMGESMEYIERALASRTAGSMPTAREEARLLRVLAGASTLTKGPRPFVRNLFLEALEIAERTDDLNGCVQALLSLSAYCLYAGHYREAAAHAEKCCAIGAASSDIGHRLMGAGVAGPAFYCLGDFLNARRHIDSILNQDASTQQYWFRGYKVGAQSTLSNLQWLGGFPDQAIQSVKEAIEQSESAGNPVIRMDALAQAACSIALSVGDLEAAERWIATLLDLSTKSALPVWNARGRCLKGMLLIARGDKNGSVLLQDALGWLREANFVFLRAIPTAAMAQSLAAAGQFTEAHALIDDMLDQAERNEERWCLPELLRTKGEILRSEGSANAEDAAEDRFQQALEEARRQGALSWELRAATSLARLGRDEGRTAAARELLAGVYDRFTEGFDTLDLRAARALIGELG